MKKVIALMVVFAIFLAGCTKVVYVEVTPAPTATPTAAPTVAPTEYIPEATEPASSEAATSEFDPNSIVALLDASLEDGDGLSIDVEYDVSSDLYTIYITSDGLAAVAINAINGDADSISAWDGLVESFIGINDTSTEMVRAFGSSGLVSCVLLNDLNTDKVLLSSLDSVMIYDSTK